MKIVADTVAHSAEAHLPFANPLVKSFVGRFSWRDALVLNFLLPVYQMTHFIKNTLIQGGYTLIQLSTVFLEIFIVSLALGLSAVGEEGKNANSSWNRLSLPQPEAIRTGALIIISVLCVCKEDIILENLTAKFFSS